MTTPDQPNPVSMNLATIPDSDLQMNPLYHQPTILGQSNSSSQGAPSQELHALCTYSHKQLDPTSSTYKPPALPSQLLVPNVSSQIPASTNLPALLVPTHASIIYITPLTMLPQSQPLTPSTA